MHVRRCWASGFSAHALAYRRRFGGASAGCASHDLAVGVLELVDARSAGVAFTLDPVTGDRQRLVVEANWGFGESVVSGQVTPDHWTVDRATGRVLTERTGAKRAWAVFSPEAGRVVLRPLPGDLAGAAVPEPRTRCATSARRRRRSRTAAGGVPQDVEWAIARDLPFPDSVFFLQHRPETTGRGRAPPGSDAADAAGEPGQPPAGAPKAFDPVQYALRNVFKVPGTMTDADPGRGGRARRRPGRAARSLHERLHEDELEIGYKDAQGEPGDRRRPRVAAGRHRDDPDRVPRPRRRRRGRDDGRQPGRGRRLVRRPARRDHQFHPRPAVLLRVGRARGRRGGTTVAGAVYDPLRDEMFVAARGGGATSERDAASGVSDIARLDRALVVGAGADGGPTARSAPTRCSSSG